MRYLLDTHILFWSMCDEGKIPEDTLSVINDMENEVFFSSASVWEVVIKHDKSPDNMPVGGNEFIEGCIRAGYFPLPIENKHVLAVSRLNRRENALRHNDPFDRVLIAQAKTEGMKLITHDEKIAGYDEECIIIV